MNKDNIHVSQIKGIPLTVEGIEQATYGGIKEGLNVAAKIIRNVQIEDDDPGYIAFRDELAKTVENSIYQIAVITMPREVSDADQ